MTDYGLHGRVAVVTGASAGLGEQFCHGLAASGAAVLLAARRTEELEGVAEAIRSEHGVRAVPLKTDVAREEDIVRMVETAVAELGGLDILINNAGMLVAKPVVEQTLADWELVLRVNLTSVFLGAREAAKVMVPQGSGAIVNISSIFAFGAEKRFPEVGYHASKGGINALTKALAVELGKSNIRVNALAPGYFPSEMSAPAFGDELRDEVITPRLALPEPAELEWVRGAVCFLASDDARFITGECLVVDGGHLVHF